MAGQASYDLVLHKDADPRTGGVAICGFSTVGMVGVIAASHVISQLDLTQQGTVLNSEFPAMALAVKVAWAPCRQVPPPVAKPCPEVLTDKVQELTIKEAVKFAS